MGETKLQQCRETLKDMEMILLSAFNHGASPNTLRVLVNARNSLVLYMNMLKAMQG